MPGPGYVVLKASEGKPAAKATKKECTTPNHNNQLMTENQLQKQAYIIYLYNLVRVYIYIIHICILFYIYICFICI